MRRAEKEAEKEAQKEQNWKSTEEGFLDSRKSKMTSLVVWKTQ